MPQSKSNLFVLIIVTCQVVCLIGSANGGGMRQSNNYKIKLHPTYISSASVPRNVGTSSYYGMSNRNGMESSAMSSKFGLEDTAKLFGLTKVILSPVVIPMIIFVGIVLLLFFAVVGSSAVVGGALGRNRVPYQHRWAKQFSSTAKLATDVLESEECVEKLVCELLRKNRNSRAENWILSALESLPIKTNLVGRIARSMRSTSDCQEFSCNSRVGKALKFLHFATS